MVPGMVPRRLPRPDVLVTITGIAEVAVAAALLFDDTATSAAVARAALPVVMFSANVRAANRRLTIGGRPATPLGPRTVMQALFVAATVAVGI